MDPKMDTGLWQPGDDALFNPHQAIELGQTLGIIDKIACQEAAWLNGHSLAQTLLTCRYLKDLPKCRNSPMACLSQQVLYDYLWALIACLRLVHDEVRKGNIFEVFLLIFYVTTMMMMMVVVMASRKRIFIPIYMILLYCYAWV